jgi:hypothetical protein
MMGWIGVDLDGTLAEYHGWDASNPGIGPPIPAMVERVKQWLVEGKHVKIMTARVGHDHAGMAFVKEDIQQWCEQHIGQRLEVTCIKDFAMIELWDDRAVRVVPNQGVPCCDHHEREPAHRKVIKFQS